MAVTIKIAANITGQEKSVAARRCSKCTHPVVTYATRIKTTKELEAARDAEDERIMEIVSLLKEREKRKVMRQLKNGEIDYDPKIGKLVYTDTKEEFVFDGLSDLDSDEEDDD